MQITDIFSLFVAHESFNGSQQRIEEPIAAKRNYEPQQVAPPVPADRRHLEDVTNQTPVNNTSYSQNINNNVPKENKAIIIADDAGVDPVSHEPFSSLILRQSLNSTFHIL